MADTVCLDWHRRANVANLCDVFLCAKDEHPDRLFAVNGAMRLTYADAHAAICSFASLYGTALKGQDAALFMSNGIPALITYLGVLWAGGTPALLNAAMPKATGSKLMGALQPARAFSDHVLDFDHDAVIVSNDLVQDWIDMGAETPSACGTGDMPATYFYSGGTTGVPKRVLYTHEKILSAGERMQWGWPVQDGEVFLPIAPFSHIYGYLMGICVPLQSAGTSVIPAQFKPADVLDLMESEKVTVLGGGPPAIYLALMSVADLPKCDLSNLRVCPGGGAPFPLDVHKRWKALTGLTIYEGYGMTEMAPICVNQEGDGLRPGSAGRVVPDSSVSIVDLETGTQEQPTGTAGEIRVRGPHAMSGYCDNIEETKMTLRDGWIHTGDIGVLDDDGFLTITDRKKDVIIHKGFNVFPREVEEALISHECISNVCVVGKADARNGENIVAFVTTPEDRSTSQEVLIEHCRQYLIPYRLPNLIVFCDSLDMTPAGKVDRMTLRKRAQALVE